MFRVVGITDSFEEIVIPWNTTAVFGWAVEFSAQADRIGHPWFGWQHFLHDDCVLPTIAKVVGVDRLRTNFAKSNEEVRGAFVADGIQPHEPVARVRFPKPLFADA